MKRIILFSWLCAMCIGCSTVQPVSYSDFLRHMDDEFAESYVNGSVSDAKKALHVYLARLDELQRHPDRPDNFEISFAISRGVTKARLAALQQFLGHTEKAKAFVAAALTHLPDPQATTEEDVYNLVERMDSHLNIRWKEETTQQESGHVRK